MAECAALFRPTFVRPAGPCGPPRTPRPPRLLCTICPRAGSFLVTLVSLVVERSAADGGMRCAFPPYICSPCRSLRTTKDTKTTKAPLHDLPARGIILGDLGVLGG